MPSQVPNEGSRRPGPASLALLVGIASGCGSSEEPGRGPIRLIEHVAEAAIESAAALDESTQAALRDATILFDGPLEDADPASRFAYEGAWVGPVVLGEDDGGVAVVEAVQIAVEPGRTIRMRARMPVGREHGTPFGLELGVAQSAEKLADPAWVEFLLRGIGSFQRTLLPASASAEEVVLEIVFAPHPTTRYLLVGRAHRAGVDARPARYEVQQFDERGGWLQASLLPGRSPHVRSVSAARETRTALVLGVPGTARFELALPRGRARLIAASTPLFAEPGEELELRVEVRAGGRRVERRTSIRGAEQGWVPVELALDALAGRQAEITLSASRVGGGSTDALLAIGAPIVEGSDAGERLDVVVVSLDTVRADRTSAYGYGLETTPALARLAEQSVVFDNAITSASWTLPAHVSLFSGQYPDRHRASGQHSQVAADTPWLAEEFQRAGYVTAAFTGGGYVHPEFGFARGFDRYAVDDPAYPPVEWTEHRRRAGIEQGPVEVDPARSRVELAALLGEERRSPMFLFVHTYAAHNYSAGPQDLLAVGAAPEEVDELVLGFDGHKPRRTQAELSDEEQAERLRVRAPLLYDAALRVADRLLADVVEALRASGRLERTILVVLSDHGEELFERDELGHGYSVYEELVRVPLVVRVPRVAPARVPDVVSLVDLAPTLRALCALPADAARAELDDGTSLVPLLRGATLAPRAVIARGDKRDFVTRCLRSRDLKYMLTERPGDDPHGRLFLLAEDPLEARDRSGDRAQDAATLEATLVERVKRLESLGPIGLDAEVSGELLQSLRELGYLGD